MDPGSRVQGENHAGWEAQFGMPHLENQVDHQASTDVQSRPQKTILFWM